MEAILKILNTILPILYAVTAVAYVIFFYRNDNLFLKALNPLLLTTVVIHFLFLLLSALVFNHLPLHSVFQVLSVVAFSLALVYLYIERKVKVKATGFFILFLVFLLQQIASSFFSITSKINELFTGFWFGAHTTLAVLGYSAFAVSAVYGVLYLLLYFNLKASHFGIIYKRLPPLEILENMSRKAFSIGWIFLTLAIIFGIYWFKQVYNEFRLLDPKILTTIIAWVIYGISTLGSIFWSFQGKKLIYFSLLGFGIIIFSLLVINFLFPTFHQFT